MTAERWLSFQQAVQVAIHHGGISIGRAEHLVRSAKASGEVRIKKYYDPVLLTAEDGIVGMDLRPGAMKVTADGKELLRGIDQLDGDDLRDWLRRHLSPAFPKRKGRRYAADDKLVTRAVAGIRKEKWANPSQAATALADRAEGTSRASAIDRLRRKISAALGE